jgi:hypothetical protein
VRSPNRSVGTLLVDGKAKLGILRMETLTLMHAVIQRSSVPFDTLFWLERIPPQAIPCDLDMHAAQGEFPNLVPELRWKT